MQEWLTRREDKTWLQPEVTKVETQPQTGGIPIRLTEFRGYKVIKEFPATGGEADTYLIEKDGKVFFLKLYRSGVVPKESVLRKTLELSRKIPEHVVLIFEYGFEQKINRWFEIQEYARFGSLLDFVRSRNLYSNTNFVHEVVKELSECIHALHTQGIVHRDLKPSNVLVRDEHPLDLVLTDFGISSLLEEDVSKIFSTVRGTYAYFAPESFSGYFGKEVDWWAFGVILLELLTGKNPLLGLSPQVIMHTLSTKGIEVPDSLSEEWRLLLRGLLTRDPQKRWGYEQVQRWLKGDRNIPVYETETSKTHYKLEEWLKAGFTEAGARAWMQVIDDPDKAVRFKDELGFSPEEAKKWVEVGLDNPKIVGKWYTAGFDNPQDVKVYEDLAIGPPRARSLLSKGIDAKILLKGVKEIGLDVSDVERVGEFFKDRDRVLVALEYIKAMKSAGVTDYMSRLSTIQSLIGYSITPDEVLTVLREVSTIGQLEVLIKFFNHKGVLFLALEYIKVMKSVGIVDYMSYLSVIGSMMHYAITPDEMLKIFTEESIDINQLETLLKFFRDKKKLFIVLEYIRAIRSVGITDYMLNLSAIESIIRYSISPDEMLEALKAGLTISELEQIAEFFKDKIKVFESIKYIKVMKSVGITNYMSKLSTIEKIMQYSIEPDEMLRALKEGVDIDGMAVLIEYGFSIDEIINQKELCPLAVKIKSFIPYLCDSKEKIVRLLNFLKLIKEFSAASIISLLNNKSKQIKTIIESNITEEKLKVLLKNGLSVDDIFVLVETKVGWQEVLEWKYYDFSADEIVKGIRYGFTPSELALWKENGFSVDDAFRWKSMGFSVEKARFWSRFTNNPERVKFLKIVAYTYTFLGVFTLLSLLKLSPKAASDLFSFFVTLLLMYVTVKMLQLK